MYDFCIRMCDSLSVTELYRDINDAVFYDRVHGCALCVPPLLWPECTKFIIRFYACSARIYNAGVNPHFISLFSFISKLYKWPLPFCFPSKFKLRFSRK